MIVMNNVTPAPNVTNQIQKCKASCLLNLHLDNHKSRFLLTHETPKVKFFIVTLFLSTICHRQQEEPLFAKTSTITHSPLTSLTTSLYNFPLFFFHHKCHKHYIFPCQTLIQ